jgi:ArsR family transcriptional regulator, arsenate/arsenite/antimonite-responsive transcriptional repressor
MNESLSEIERVFMAFGDKTRLQLLYLMRNGEVSVNYLCESLGTSQPKVSRHLAYLRSMDIVQTRRDGKWIFYSLNEPESRIGSQLLRDTLAWIGSAPEIGYSSTAEFRSPAAPAIAAASEDLDPTIYVKPYIYDAEDEMEVYLL